MSLKFLAFVTVSTLLLLSCERSTNSNGNDVVTVVPVPPINLSATVASPIQINLSWTDKSTNETGFRIQRKSGSGVFTEVGSTATDVTVFSDNGLTPNTTYYYRVLSYNSVGPSATYSNEVSATTTSLPVLNTKPIGLVLATTFTSSGGKIQIEGGSAITAKGVCWGTSPAPTINLSTKTNDGNGIDSFSSSLTGLSANTTYYLRAYATNAQGTGYGNEISFTTPVANTVKIGTQVWMTKNLNVTTYRNGDPIPNITNQASWSGTTAGAWCYYENDSIVGIDKNHGKLYNLYAVKDPRGLAPAGWHIPSQEEWLTLINNFGGMAIAGKELKIHYVGWGSQCSATYFATNSSGFTAMGSGMNSGSGFRNYLIQVNFWTSTVSVNNGYTTNIYCSDNVAIVGSGPYAPTDGFSVRCIKD